MLQSNLQILEKKTKNVLENGWWKRTLVIFVVGVDERSDGTKRAVDFESAPSAGLYVLIYWPKSVLNAMKMYLWTLKKFNCLWFYAVSTVFQLFNGDSSQIHVSWTIFDQYLISPIFWHWRASRSAIPIILSANGEKPLLPVLKTLVCRGRGSNPRLPAHKADALTTRPGLKKLKVRLYWKCILIGVLHYMVHGK